jgi:hypothetical protein
MFSLHDQSTLETIFGRLGVSYCRWEEEQQTKIQILIENRTAVNMDASFKYTQRTRHMMRIYHYVREGVESNQHSLIWIMNMIQLADMGTRILGRTLLGSFKELVFVKVPE